MVILAGDIGGTNTRLGLFTIGKDRPVASTTQTYPSRKAAGLEDILDLFLKTKGVPIAGACFGIAGPVKDGRCRATNLPWEVSEKQIKRRFQWERVRLINDLSAMAYAIPALRKKELFALNQGRRRPNDPIGLIAPGTGLGMALLIQNNQRHIPIASEGGHADFAPKNADESRLWQYLHDSLGHVSIERVLSGPGLVNIYSWLKHTGRETEPDWLARRMQAEDPARVISATALKKKTPICVKTLDVFVSVFGAVSGNLALIGLTRAGIYLGGGIAPQILEKLREGIFMKAFADKGRFAKFMRQIPVDVILHEQPALLGAAICAFTDCESALNPAINRDS
jgi:glucokinase